MTVVSARAAAPAQLFSGPPRYTPSSPWGPWGALGALLLVLLGQLIGGIAVVAIYVFKNGGSNFDTQAGFEAMMSMATPIGVATMIASQIGSIVAVWLLAGRQGRRADVLQMHTPAASLSTCIAGGLLSILATGIVEIILYQVVKDNVQADTKFIADGLNSPMWWGTILIAVVFAPLWEELTFRGFLLSSLAQTRLGFWGAALISNALWTALHAQYGWAGIGSVFTAGLVLSWLVWRTGSIRAPIIAHGIANTAAAAFAYFYTPAVQAVPA